MVQFLHEGVLAMIRIAIVDDEKAMVEMINREIKSALISFNIQCEISQFTDGNVFFQSCIESRYDLVLLDIDMPQISGIDIAQKIRTKQTDTEIIFVTNRDELVYDTIKYTPFRFIRKFRFDMEISEALESFLKKVESNKKTKLFSTEHGKKVVAITDILYIEVGSHKLTVYMQQECFVANGNLKDLEKEISQYGFIRIHQGYLVNFRCINIIGQKDVVLDDGTKLPLSRKRIEESKSKLMRYSREL